MSRLRPPARLPGYEHLPARVYWLRIEFPDWVAWAGGRILCRLLRIHNKTCRGRADHMPSLPMGAT